MYTNGTTTISGKKIVVDGRVILNPTKEQLQDAGWREVVPPTPTDGEVAEQLRLAEIDGLKALLMESDYKALKYAEGWLTAEEYAPIKAERQQWRKRINELEGGVQV